MIGAPTASAGALSAAFDQVLAKTASVNDAVAAARSGCDLVVVQGHEAGGHLAGTHALLPLLCEVLDLVDIPALAAGGITTSRALAAVLAAGAAGARIGTALVVSEEADFHADYKHAVVKACSADAVYSNVFDAFWPNAQHRVLRSAIDAVQSLSVGSVSQLRPAATIVRELAIGARELLQVAA
jgi:NAD(P)H-dependent flavin oxidoreductase YrpB (nitropropane dioxygenase family)